MPPALLTNAAVVGAGAVSVGAGGAAWGAGPVAHAPQSASAQAGARTVLRDVIRSVVDRGDGETRTGGTYVVRALRYRPEGWTEIAARQFSRGFGGPGRRRGGCVEPRAPESLHRYAA